MPASAAVLVGEVDEPDARDDRVERARRHVELLAVDDLRLDVRQPGVARAALARSSRMRGEMSVASTCRRADAPGRRERLPAGAGGHVEHAAAGADTGQVEHHLGRLAEPGRRVSGPTGARARLRLATGRWSCACTRRVECRGAHVNVISWSGFGKALVERLRRMITRARQHVERFSCKPAASSFESGSRHGALKIAGGWRIPSHRLAGLPARPASTRG